MKLSLRVKTLTLIVLSVTLAFCMVFAFGTSDKKVAKAEMQVPSAVVAQTYGVGYTLNLEDVSCQIEEVQTVAHTAIKKDGKTLASSSSENEFTFTEIGAYQIVYYTYLDGNYYNKTVNFSVTDKPYFDFSQINSSYNLGDELGLKIDVVANGVRHTANVTLSGPDGEISATEEYKFSMLGNYTLTAQVVIDEINYSESVSFVVENKTYTNLVYVKDGSAEIEGNYNAPAYRNEGNGLRVKPVSGTVLRYANIINLNSFDKYTNLISFVAFLGGDFTDINSVSMIFTDKYDENNVVELEVYSLQDSSQTFYRVNFGAVSAGINPNDSLPTLKYAARVTGATMINKYHEKGSYIGKMKKYLSCSYQPEEKAFYAIIQDADPVIVLDLDDPKHTGLGREWSGWTTGEVYADIEIVCEANSQLLITELFGQSFSGTQISDGIAPSLITEIAEDILPVGQVGKKYKIPQVVSALDVVEGDISLSSIKIQVSRIEGKNIIDCTSFVEKGYLTPQTVGNYRVEYYVQDSVGNSSVKVSYFTVESASEQPQIICELDQNLTVGSRLILPDVKVVGLSSIVESYVKYIYAGEELTDVKAGDSIFLNKKGEFKVVYYFKDYIGTEIFSEKSVELKVNQGPVITLSGVPYTAIKGKTLILPDFDAVDYNFNSNEQGYVPERAITVNGTKLDASRKYQVTENAGSVLEVVFSAGSSSQTRYIDVIEPTYISDYFITTAQKTNKAEGIEFKFNKDVWVKLANPTYANNTLGLNAILSLDNANFETFTLKITDYYDLSKQISFVLDVASSSVKINGVGEAYAVDISQFLNLKYNNFSKQLVDCGLIKTYLNGTQFESFKDMVIVEFAFGGVSAESSVMLTTLNRVSLGSTFDKDGVLLPFDDSEIEPTVLYKVPTYENGMLTIYKAVAWRLFSGEVEVKVKLTTPGGVPDKVNNVSANKDYVVETSRYGWYTARYTAEGWPLVKNGKFELVDKTPVEFSLNSSIPSAVSVGETISLPVVNIIKGSNVSSKFVIIEPDGVSTIYDPAQKVKLSKAGLVRVMLIMTGDTVNETAYFEIKVKG